MNKIATLFHPKIYGGTMLLTLNSSTKGYLLKCGLMKHHPAGEAMKRFIIEQSSADIISHSGLSL
uniref:hypothetical protein n=1 Tax=Thiolapillus sp. TaxID=2017437 RepID=UPI003AF7CCB9